MSTLTFLFETKQNRDHARRAQATEDRAWASSGAQSEQGLKGLRKHISQLEALSEGAASPSPSDDADRIEL